MDIPALPKPPKPFPRVRRCVLGVVSARRPAEHSNACKRDSSLRPPPQTSARSRRPRLTLSSSITITTIIPIFFIVFFHIIIRATTRLPSSHPLLHHHHTFCLAFSPFSLSLLRSPTTTSNPTAHTTPPEWSHNRRPPPSPSCLC